MGKNYEIKLEDATLKVALWHHLSADNASLLLDELSKYVGQDIKKVIFDVTGLIFISSSGLRSIFYAYHELGNAPEIIFVNCVSEIREVLDHVGITSFIKFEENADMKKDYRRNHLTNLSKEEIAQISSERQKSLDHFSANNDVVCYTMKLGQED